MATPEMIAILQKRKLELIKELQAIDVLLGAETAKTGKVGPQPTTRSGQVGYISMRDEHIAFLGEKTEAISWKDYVQKALKILSPARANAITDLLIDTNNRKISDQRIKSAVSAALNELVKDKKAVVKIDADKVKVFHVVS